jgi:radical SAM family uncharacterized protein
VIIPEERLALLLQNVQKPARYVGGEFNAVAGDWAHARITLALAYPDAYEIGMSNLGLALLYDAVNRQPGMIAERVYCPWGDMADALRASGLLLYALETRHTLADFDVLGFSLQHELTYTNVLEMLDLAGLPILASERTAAMPLVIAGGSGALNPEPMAAFVDAFVIGEGEIALVELLEAVAEIKTSAPGDRSALLRRLAGIEGVYVPALYKPTYLPDGRLAALTPTEPNVPARVRKRIVPVLGPVPARPIVPNIQAIHDRAMIEIQRGCSRGCRFCQAGIIYRPIRERPVAEVLDAIDTVIANTGHSEVSLISLSSSDHSGIAEIVSGAMARHQEDGLAISLPSLRIDSFSVNLAQMIQSNRKTGFTFAPEAATQRMRDVINKGVVEQDLADTTRAVFGNGWNRLKLYFMLGLPYEEDKDILAIADLIGQVRYLARDLRSRFVEIAVSLSTFVPKPHTPFQWQPLLDRETVERRQRSLVNRTRVRGVHLSWSRWEDTWLEALISRGDRRLAPVIARVWRAGGRFEAWSEHFHPELWHAALEAEGLDADWYTVRPREQNEVLPWDHIDVGVSRAFLWTEFERAATGALSPDCREICHDCGINRAYAELQPAGADRAWGCP